MSNQRPQATPTVQIDDERVIVTEWHFKPGAETGWHTHGHDYVVVPTTDGELLLETENGPVNAQLKLGQSYTRKAGVRHNVINAGSEPLVFVEVELR
ncbi:cupin domain-containing protein [Orrella marina]|uniref:Cupin n=1 Tax=Orrella marina TaxID=2163011 RepID=A0A2R4XIX9_9BURK|nr:cupin domain-containing protein [Orrella marina]AWB33760.1 cupin [Orrella marina]